MSRDELSRRLHNASMNCVAESARGKIVAFCSVGRRLDRTAALLVLLVDPAHRRQGIGTRLLRYVESTLSEQSVTNLGLGFAGEGEFFWQGVPADSGAWPFFVHNGWRERENSSDLVLDLKNYVSPPWVFGRSNAADIKILTAGVGLRQATSLFERKNFPLWFPFFAGKQSYRDCNIVVAVDPAGAIVGSVLLSSTLSVPWKHALGAQCGSLGVLGVAKHMEGKGIGLALAAYGAEALRQRHASACHIGWTGLVDWYGKLGAKPWAEYHMGLKTIVPSIEAGKDLKDGVALAL